MAAGQAVLSGVVDVGALSAVETRLEQREHSRHGMHAEQLRDALELDRLHHQAGLDLATTAQLALVLRCSEARAARLLDAARLLAGLPAALELLDAAVLTVEQSWVVVEQLGALDEVVRQAVWERVSARLLGDAEQGVLRPPARLGELLRRWVLEADPASAQERRRRAEEHGDVTYRSRDDGTVDLFATGLTEANAAACLSRISERSAPFGAGDERSAGKRRVDALVDLVCGRDALPFDENDEHRQTCDCPLDASVPCGAQVTVLVPLSTALGGSAPAELVGHGPLDADLAQQVLAAAPVLRVAWVDDDGVPVAVSDRVERPGRGAEVTEALRRLTADPPRPQPRHPDDHDTSPPPDERVRVRSRAHPPDTAGPYRPPAASSRLLHLRAPRCEWPGCGARSSRCDLDHDLAWPCGPTCACNLGPLCRRHHRVKQLGWHKQRTTDGVRWTSPTGRTRLSPFQHQPPRSDTVRIETARDPLDELSPLGRERELHPADPYFDGLDIDSNTDTDTCGWDPARADEEQWAADLAALRRQAARDNAA